MLPSPISDWRSSSTSLAMAARSLGPLVVFWPATSSWRTRSTNEDACVIAESAEPSQVRPSSTSRPSCSVRVCSPRSRIAAAVSVGESDGRLSRRPEDSCCWVCCSRARLACSPLITLRFIVAGVTRMDIVVPAFSEPC